MPFRVRFAVLCVFGTALGSLVGCTQEPTPVVSEPPAGCDPNYSGCVPGVDYDLDCADIDGPVQVLGGDPHGFDRDADGIGCEAG
jgi:hypothetical protein